MNFASFAIPKPLRRHKPHTRPDRVDESLRLAVLQRDGCCFLRLLHGAEGHQCADQWGEEHSSYDLSKLTVDHVHMDGAHMGDRAPSDLQHLVAMCAHWNIAGPSANERAAERVYLRSLYDCL